MPIHSVYQYIASNLAPNSSTEINDKMIDDFLIELRDSKNVNSLRLLICIGIDIKSSIKKFKTNDIYLNKVIEGLRDCINKACSFKGTFKTFPGGIPAQVRFSIAQKQISPTPYFPCISTSVGCRYSRVYQFYKYMINVVKINRNPILNPEIVDDIDENEMTRYLNEFLYYGKYKNIHITRIGREKSWVFIADTNEILATNYKTIDRTEEIIDRLGFYIENLDPGGHYICIDYDSSFNESTFQPDSLTGDWGNIVMGKNYRGNEFFLSNPIIDDWGRTQSVSGTTTSLRERVHSNFDFNGLKHYKIEGNYIGTLNIVIPRLNNFVILKEALNRFHRA